MSARLTFHGGRIGDACSRYGGQAEDWLDLSTGINPCPWPGTTCIHPGWQALPDPRALALLERTAADFFGVDPAFCCAVPGSEVALRALARILDLPGRHRDLCYGTHAAAFAQSEAVSPQPETAPSPSVLVLANPNNPDGEVSPHADLLIALDRQEASGGWLIADEAFADCHPAWSIADRVANGRRLIVTRSFGKFFGLAGLRLGFVIAPQFLLDDLRGLLGEWPVNAAALAFGTSAYADTRWIADTRAQLPVAAQRLDVLLARHGLSARGACPLFRLVETDVERDLFEALASRQILTRPFAGHPRLLRFGLPADADGLARLEAALRHG